MNRDQLEAAVRATLRENVADITADSLSGPMLGNRSAEHKHRWLGPLLAAAAVVVVVGISVGIRASIAPGHHSGIAPPSAGSSSSGVALTGKWRLVSATAHGSNLEVSARPAVILTFEDDSTLAIDDGVNTTFATIHPQANAFTGRFRSTTYVLDGSADKPQRRALLRLLDSIAPGATPSVSASNTYLIEGQYLTIGTSFGELRLVRD
jgi:hypothetical protein